MNGCERNLYSSLTSAKNGNLIDAGGVVAAPPHYPPLVEPLRPGPTLVPLTLSNPLTNLLSVSPTPARTLLFFFALLPAARLLSLLLLPPMPPPLPPLWPSQSPPPTAHIAALAPAIAAAAAVGVAAAAAAL